MIRVEGLVHDYPDGVRALDGIDLRIGPGEVVGLSGPNGAGKSTLVRHWNGLLRPSAGRVLIGGRDVAGRHVADLARTVAVGAAEPEDQLFAGRVRAEVAFGPRNLGLRGPQLEAAVDAALDLVGLADVADRNPYDLGPARRRLVVIAAVVAMDSPVVVFDEPTVGQDARGLARVAGVMRALEASGRTIVLIGHDRDFLAATCRRLVIMTAGRVTADEPTVT